MGALEKLGNRVCTWNSCNLKTLRGAIEPNFFFFSYFAVNLNTTSKVGSKDIYTEGNEYCELVKHHWSPLKTLLPPLYSLEVKLSSNCKLPCSLHSTSTQWVEERCVVCNRHTVYVLWWNVDNSQVNKYSSPYSTI